MLVGGIAAGTISNVERLNIVGGSGNDRIGAVLHATSPGGTYTFTGNAGTDTVVIDATAVSASYPIYFAGGIAAGRLYDTQYGTTINITGIEVLEFTGNAISSTVINGVTYTGVSGGSGNDILTGLGQSDTFDGGAGDDTITGGAGNDDLKGGTGNNVIDGGTGTDTALVDYSDRTGDLVLVNSGVAGQVQTVLVGGIAAGTISNVERLNIVGGSGNDGLARCCRRSAPVEPTRSPAMPGRTRWLSMRRRCRHSIRSISQAGSRLVGCTTQITARPSTSPALKCWSSPAMPMSAQTSMASSTTVFMAAMATTS